MNGREVCKVILQWNAAGHGVFTFSEVAVSCFTMGGAIFERRWGYCRGVKISVPRALALQCLVTRLSSACVHF